MAEAGRLEELRLVALEERIEADVALGRHAELLPELRSLADAYPRRERLQAQAMLALYRCGRQSEALEVYAAARVHLRDELGLEPAPSSASCNAGSSNRILGSSRRPGRGKR